MSDKVRKMEKTNLTTTSTPKDDKTLRLERTIIQLKKQILDLKEQNDRFGGLKSQPDQQDFFADMSAISDRRPRSIMKGMRESLSP